MADKYRNRKSNPILLVNLFELFFDPEVYVKILFLNFCYPWFYDFIGIY